MKKHTPGPWLVEEGTTIIWSNNCYDAGTNNVGCIVARAAHPVSPKASRPTADERVANAYLIAAAPDLKAELERLHEIVADAVARGMIESCPEVCAALHCSASAINKSGGYSDDQNHSPAPPPEPAKAKDCRYGRMAMECAWPDCHCNNGEDDSAAESPLAKIAREMREGTARFPMADGSFTGAKIPEPAKADDWGELSVRIAEAVLLDLGIGFEPSHDPGADRRRDRLCALIDPMLTTPPTAPAAARSAAEEWEPTHRHVKRGSFYRVIGEADAQVNEDGMTVGGKGARVLCDGDALIIYEGANGKMWARFPDEFNDGRFVALPGEEA
ncbi:hypothetical protein [Xanthobacter autotrophicus]|uniref:hypothetical protein n=1 Tax=Xanthobacter autotrophicus TaxID=280 RepID=UPI003729E41B